MVKIKLAYRVANGKLQISANQVDITMSVMGMNQSDVYTLKQLCFKGYNILSNGSAEGML